LNPKKLAGSVDTNILVRLVAQDDAVQCPLVHRLLAEHAQRDALLFVATTVVLELEWVLRTRYKQTKPQVIAVFAALLQCVEFSFESEDALEQALVDYEESNADFGECLHLALSRKADALPFWTFDRKASKSAGAEVLV
jgi:predicted nucleic-acid-binding protein